MADLRVTVTMDDPDRVIPKLKRLEPWFKDFREQLNEGAARFYGNVVMRFRTEGRWAGYRSPKDPKWAELSDYSKQRRARAAGKGASIEPDYPILYVHGGLFHAATSNDVVQEWGVTGGQRYLPHSLELKLEGDKVRNHFGFDNDVEGWDRVPARPIWPWNEEIEDLFFGPFKDWSGGWLMSPEQKN